MIVGLGSRIPCIFLSAGTTKRLQVTTADTGLPTRKQKNRFKSGFSIAFKEKHFFSFKRFLINKQRFLFTTKIRLCFKQYSIMYQVIGNSAIKYPHCLQTQCPMRKYNSPSPWNVYWIVQPASLRLEASYFTEAPHKPTGVQSKSG